MLLFLSLLVQISSQIAVRQTCTASHIWLESNDDQMALSALNKHHCVATYRSQTVVDRYCLGPNGNLTLTVAPKVLWSELRNNIVVSCPEISADEPLYPVSTSVAVNSDGRIEIIIEEHQKLILSSRLTVTDCFILSVDMMRIDLLDRNGCPVQNRLSQLEESQVETRRTLTGKLSTFLLPPSAQLQCSVVSCGSDCLLPCGERNNEMATSTRILLSTFIPKLRETSALQLQSCSWWLQRALFVLIATSLFVSTILLAYMTYRNCPWTLEQIRQMVRVDRRRRRGQLQIIHPIDMFDSPPVITKRLSSTKKRVVHSTSCSSISSEETKRVTSNDSVKSVDAKLTFMENLPEPPNIPVSKLAEIVRRKSIEDDYAEICKIPTPLKRTISKTSTNIQPSQLTSENLRVRDAISLTFKTFGSESLSSGESFNSRDRAVL